MGSSQWLVAAAGVILAFAIGLLVHSRVKVTSQELLAAAERDHRIEIVNGQPRRWLVDRAAITTLAIGQGVTQFAHSGLAAGFADGRFSALAVAGDLKTAEALAHSMSIGL